ncbi:hypothetical protein [Pyramidobacter sp. CG50-2]|uniref:hypothetical protein n=1 Tax=Pyramidobacter sp. CG50-2 TaxID=2382160 RepID=UPI0013159D63|nr:hypothetical protein [Pyramidobacter sp. CG50-2]
MTVVIGINAIGFIPPEKQICHFIIASCASMQNPLPLFCPHFLRISSPRRLPFRADMI